MTANFGTQVACGPPIMASTWASPSAPSPDARGARILAKTVYRELRQNGLRHEDLIAFAAEMIGLVASGMKGTEAAQGGPTSRT
ncbi:MAG: hypothetical protein HY908_16870 [Myxococcales bacterium]|nr:hypothetical protein [Myxococcales bacterium]